MKIIDKTPFVKEDGKLGVPQMIQGMLQFGFRWPTELEAQKAIVTFFDRHLEKGYTLIRNLPLGASGIVVPIILLGPAGLFAINVTYLRGRYEARANTWNQESGDGYKPASVNLVQETSRMAKAVAAFIERQGVKLPVDVEPVLIGANPGIHIEAVRPAIRVVMIDGVRSFVTKLGSSNPVLSTEAVHEFSERLLNPRPARKRGEKAPAAPPRAAWEDEKTKPPRQEVSRARAIFEAAEEAEPLSPTDFDFAMFDEQEPILEAPAVEASSPVASAAPPLSQAAAPRRRPLGLTPLQMVIIGALFLALVCILVVFAVLFLSPSLLP